MIADQLATVGIELEPEELCTVVLEAGVGHADIARPMSVSIRVC